MPHANAKESGWLVPGPTGMGFNRYTKRSISLSCSPGERTANRNDKLGITGFCGSSSAKHTRNERTKTHVVAWNSRGLSVDLVCRRQRPGMGGGELRAIPRNARLSASDLEPNSQKLCSHWKGGTFCFGIRGKCRCDRGCISKSRSWNALARSCFDCKVRRCGISAGNLVAVICKQ